MQPTTPRLEGPLRRWSPFLVPLLYLVGVLALQPADHLGDPEVAPWLNRLLYDDYDVTAMAQRGLNAQLGRRAGAPPPERVSEAEFCTALDHGPPLRPRYFLEYPYAALLFFRSAFLVQPSLERSQLPPAVLDADHTNLVSHLPRTPEEGELWCLLRGVIRSYEAFTIVCLLVLMLVLRVGYDADDRLRCSPALLLLPATLYFSLNRYDVVPALLVALSLACTGRRRVVPSAVFLAVATALKVYPLLLAPLLWRYFSASLRTALFWAAVYGATVAACLLPPLVFSDATAAWAPYLYQLSRPPERGLTAYGYVLPEAWEETRLLRLGLLAVFLTLLSVTRPPDLASLVRRGALVIMLFITLPVFWSPQWILWLVPLVLPLAARSPVLAGLFIGLDVVTYFSFPILYDSDWAVWGWALIALVYARFALLAALAFGLGWAEWRRLRSRRAWSSHSLNPSTPALS